MNAPSRALLAGFGLFGLTILSSVGAAGVPGAAQTTPAPAPQTASAQPTPQVAPGGTVGNDICHAGWEGSAHDRRNSSCTTCHSVRSPQSPAHQLVKATQTQLCATCHRAEVVKTERAVAHMPVREGKMTCTSCHNPHGSITNVKALKTGNSVGELCTTCHTEMRGADALSALPRRDAASVHLRQRRDHREQEQVSPASADVDTSPNLFEVQPNQAAMRYLDITNRTRNRFTGQVDFVVVDGTVQPSSLVMRYRPYTAHSVVAGFKYFW